MDQALHDILVINSMRALHAKNVKEQYYDEKAKTVEDLIKLNDTEDQIRELESKWQQCFYNFPIQSSVTVKECAELFGCSTSTIYRYIYSKKLMAVKINNRWQILTNLDAIQYVA